ncbi:hypothetical protein D3C87_2166230 [compost metagenome]
MPAGELDATLAHQGVVAAASVRIAQLVDEIIGLGMDGGFLDLGIARVGTSIGDVVAYGSVQQ